MVLVRENCKVGLFLPEAEKAIVYLPLNKQSLSFGATGYEDGLQSQHNRQIFSMAINKVLPNPASLPRGPIVLHGIYRLMVLGTPRSALHSMFTFAVYFFISSSQQTREKYF